MASWARAVPALFITAFVIVAGCNSDPEASTGGDYCGTAKSVSDSGKCKEPTDCDGTLASEACGSLSKVVSQATLNAAKDCLDSGVCGPAACLARAQKNVSPTKAHKTLAANFCQFCAPNVQDCEAQFFSKTGRLPGRLVLPYADDIVKEVDDKCTGNEGCQAQFTQCVTETVTAVAGERLDASAASCVVAGFTQDEGEGKGPGGGATVATCTAANCQGCCREDKCEEGKSNETCGAGAAACEICAGTQQCIAGKCTLPDATTCK